MTWNADKAWVRSDKSTHAALVPKELFEQARGLLVSTPDSTARRKRRTTSHPFVLRGLLHCAVCSRRMQGHWSHGSSYYRCRYPNEYALANRIAHPRNVFLREDEVVPALDGWLAELLHPDRIEATCQTLLAAQVTGGGEQARVAAFRGTLAEYNAKLRKYREALEAGTDPAVVAAWIREVTMLKEQTEQELRCVRPQRQWSGDEIRRMLRALEDPGRALASARPETKAELYGDLGLGLSYEPVPRRVLVEADLAWGYDRVGGGI